MDARVSADSVFMFGFSRLGIRSFHGNHPKKLREGLGNTGIRRRGVKVYALMVMGIFMVSSSVLQVGKVITPLSPP